MLALTESRIGHRLVLAVAGEIDMATAHSLSVALAGAAESGAAELWLDLTDVEFMDSTGITAIVETHNRLDGHCHLSVICPDGPVRHVIAVAGIDRVIAIHPTRSAAQ